MRRELPVEALDRARGPKPGNDFLDCGDPEDPSRKLPRRRSPRVGWESVLRYGVVGHIQAPGEPGAYAAFNEEITLDRSSGRGSSGSRE